MTFVDISALAGSIDQTMLKPTVGPREGADWIAANRDHGFATLCHIVVLTMVRKKQLNENIFRCC